jgi:hypothetical protein
MCGTAKASAVWYHEEGKRVRVWYYEGGVQLCGTEMECNVCETCACDRPTGMDLKDEVYYDEDKGWTCKRATCNLPLPTSGPRVDRHRDPVRGEARILWQCSKCTGDWTSFLKQQQFEGSPLKYGLHYMVSRRVTGQDIPTWGGVPLFSATLVKGQKQGLCFYQQYCPVRKTCVPGAKKQCAACGFHAKKRTLEDMVEDDVGNAAAAVADVGLVIESLD